MIQLLIFHLLDVITVDVVASICSKLSILPKLKFFRASGVMLDLNVEQFLNLVFDLDRFLRISKSVESRLLIG